MFDVGVVEILVAVATSILSFFFYNTATHNFWKQRNVPGPKPNPLFGNFMDVVLMKTSQAEHFRDLYFRYKKEPFFGIFQGRVPILMVNDPAILKHVLIKDFPIFADRVDNSNERVDPLTMNLFHIDGHRWKGLRSKLSPTFTSGKLRQMFYLLTECADHFEKHLVKLVAKGEPIECREITAKFTTDVIGSCAFGIDMKALEREDSDFRRMGRDSLKPSSSGTVLRFLREFFPKLYCFLGFRFFPEAVSIFFLKTMKETIEYRKKNTINRHDFVDLLMQIQANPDKSDFELTDELITAQAFMFFLAGFETSSSTISYALYELAQIPSIQEKLRNEIVETLERYDGKETYDAVKEMKFLDMVFQETLRRNPPVPFLNRESLYEYTIPGTNINIPAKQKVVIPILGLHNDPDYFHKPEVFDPERFSEESKQARQPMVYLPFGDGPRNCIGARFAVFQTKMGIIKLLKNYRVTPCEKTEIPYIIERKSFILTPVRGIHLNFTKLD